MDVIACLGRYLLAIFFVSAVSGCAVTSLFSPYPDQAQTYKSSIGSIQVVGALPVNEAVLVDLGEERDSADAMLYMMERGRIAQLSSRYAESREDFEVVIDGFESQDLASTIEASGLAAEGAAMLTNDNAIPYSGAGYERIFVHHHQAFNYWGEGDIEGASIEFRKVALEQQILLEQFEKEIAEAQHAAEENDIDIETLSTEFAGLDTVAGKVKSSFQNAYTFYTSAAFWEAIGETNNALVDYKKAYEINPTVELIKQDIARVSNKLGSRSSQKNLNLPGENEGTVVLLFEDGFVPAKSEFKIPIPIYGGGLISLAFPMYETELWPLSNRLKVMDDNFTDFGTTQIVVDVGALAVKGLIEQIPKLLVRQVLRGFAKYELQKKSEEKFGGAGLFVASLYNVISERADRRSWLTLPNSGQVLRFNLPAGERELSLTAGASQSKLGLKIDAKKTTFVRVVHVNNRLISQVFTL